MANEPEMEVGKYWGVTFLIPSERALRGKLIKIIQTDEGPMYSFIGRFPWSVLEKDIISYEETGPETRTPRSGDGAG